MSPTAVRRLPSLAHRTARPPVLAALAAVAIAAGWTAPDPALAVKIDPELAQMMAIKRPAETMPVLMVYDLPAAGADSLLDVDKLSPTKRRDAVLAKLKEKMHKVQGTAMALLGGGDLAGRVRQVRQLYLAGAIALEAPADVIMALAALPDQATLFYDKTYDLASADRPRTASGAATKSGTKTTPPDTAWSVLYIGADRVWNELGLDGEGVVVGHIDSGVYLAHPDLAGNLWVNADEVPDNGLDDDGNGFVDDVHGWDFGARDNDPNDDADPWGHGTHTAGSVVGDGAGGTVTGVAPGARLMACKVWQADGSGGSLGMIWAAEQYCVENGARIITMSLGISGDIPAVYLRNERINCANIRDAGVLLVNSAGNDHFLYDPPLEMNLTARVPAPWAPAPVPYSSTGGVLTVGATGYLRDIEFSYSSQGPADWGEVDPWRDWDYGPGPGLTKPDVSAPGSGINSTVIPAGYSGDTWSGTSMACPHVAGVAALMLQKNPSLSPAGIDSLLEMTAVDLGAPGKDNVFGSGRIDAYAAVSAVPATVAADLYADGLLADFGGDLTLDPGQDSKVAFVLRNGSPVTAAAGIEAGLAVRENPYVNVLDGRASFPDIAPGDAADNRGDPFLLRVAPEAPQGYAFTCLLTVAAGGFERTFDIPWYVGQPAWRTHDIGSVYLTVTDQGILGYMGQDSAEGDGMGLAGSESNLYVGSFWAGTGPDYVCNRDYDGVGAGTEVHEWLVSDDKEDGGRVRDLGARSSDQTFAALFSDAGHPSPLPLCVRQHSFAFADAPDDDFVLLEYTLTNLGSLPAIGLYHGVFCDFDIANSVANLGGTDPELNLAYVRGGAGPYFGIALLDTAAAANTTLIDNNILVYPTYSIADGDKFALLSGALRTADAGKESDWSALVSGVVDLQPQESRTVVYALVYGQTLEDLQANALAAGAAYNPLTPLTPETPVKVLRLDQNVPNPFNPRTRITFALEDPGRVEVAVYDLRGRKVRALLAADVAAGPGEVFWDGTDDEGRPAPGGVYLCRLTAAGRQAATKMTLVR